MPAQLPVRRKKGGGKPGVKYLRVTITEADDPELYAFMQTIPWGTATQFLHSALVAAMLSAQGRAEASAPLMVRAVPAAQPEPAEPQISAEDEEALVMNMDQF
ncbi:hypothetical protein BJI67_16325 (plasmid) [Acidihalobacter aeolianus]|uniref:Uncharacterized protein n=1 Tax=Acidihalobacter aeolianus TaxID=2792603 RepID=A0A1D8KCZ1_9GAMM|nr:hypothetical protein [Acidihalobacter aeolianus]AOV18804.1 hypothetical protein BJI67_16325 [Acidihalobacter aeolianus]